jgi:hypothetical protein
MDSHSTARNLPSRARRHVASAFSIGISIKNLTAPAREVGAIVPQQSTGSGIKGKIFALVFNSLETQIKSRNVPSTYDSLTYVEEARRFELWLLGLLVWPSLAIDFHCG